MTGLVAIHQPNFFPWLGYFDKIRRADAYVFLDEVDYPRTGAGTWINRVRLALQGDARWFTCPIRHVPLGLAIREVQINNDQNWRAKLLRTLEYSYRRAPNYTDAMSFLVPLIETPEENLATFNVNAIQAISIHLGIGTCFLRQSQLKYSGKATELLISLVRAAGGDSYLAGGGASGYQEDEKFAAEGLGLIMQNFVPRPYGDLASFMPGLSVIDYLMHDGRPLADAFPETS
jgi:hypothetical protein